jgi:uncharacterized protein YecE (DUF72 family)
MNEIPFLPFVGTAAWNIPKIANDLFPGVGSHLERYSEVLNGVEINSTFYKEHLPKTFARWRDAVPDDFRFSVKLSRTFTHDSALTEKGAPLEVCLRNYILLGEKWGVLLVQLPPSLEFKEKIAAPFFEAVRKYYKGALVCEPRHRTWTSKTSYELFQRLKISRVWADPDPCPVPERPKWDCGDIRYLRLHGSPEIYRSEYDEARLREYADLISDGSQNLSQTWCVFDNTTFGHATIQAVWMKEKLRKDPNFQNSKPWMKRPLPSSVSASARRT